MLGNFAHSSTIGSAKQILASRLVDDPQLTVVLAGWGSERFAGEPVSVLGAVSRPEDFYAQIDCVIAPVAGGSGIKCKLAEALEAGRPVLTTPLGASGYPPQLRRHFHVCEPEQIDAAKIRLAISEFDAGARPSRCGSCPRLGHGDGRSTQGRFAPRHSHGATRSSTACHRGAAASAV